LLASCCWVLTRRLSSVYTKEIELQNGSKNTSFFVLASRKGTLL
jgi:hypothetical protein